MKALFKLTYALSLVGSLAIFTIPASAQSPMQCAGSANNPLVRAEEYTALAGDIFITCAGGTPTAAGTSIPKVTITVFVTNTTITSKLTQTTDDPNWDEALLIVDEAGTTGSSNGLLNCGSATAPFETTPNDLTCNMTSANGDGTGDYTGAAGRPNVFQGRVVDGSFGQAIQFIGVPIDPPGPCPVPSLFGYTPPCYVLPTRTMRITNLRVNAVALNVYNSGTSFSLTTINTMVSFNGTTFVGNQIVNIQNGTVRPGLTVSFAPPQSGLLTGAATFLQCSATTGNATNSVLLTEGFPTAFKVRNFAQILANGTAPPLPYQFYQWNAGHTSITDPDVSQNVANALYNTETGFSYDPADPVPATNPPAGTSSNGTAPTGTAFNSSTDNTGIASVGEVSQGTRIAIGFSGIPLGSNPSVPLAVDLETGSVSSGSVTGTLVLVCGTDTFGAGGTTASCPNSASIPGTSPLSVTAGGAAVAIYEVAFADPNALEFANVAVYVSPAPAGGTPQSNQIATVAASFAPFYATSFAGVGSAEVLNSTWPIPRFVQTAYNPCAAPVISWLNPAPIQFGSALGSGQLDATANVPGTFVYSPPVGTVLPTGNGQTLSVTFTPTDTLNYTGATATASINVLPAPQQTPPQLVITRSLGRLGNAISVTLMASNSGGSTASNVKITAAKLGTSALAFPFVPVGLGSIPAGSEISTTLYFPNVGTSGSVTTITLSGTYDGGSFSSTARITLP
jgi:hypothetical protein